MTAPRRRASATTGAGQGGGRGRTDRRGARVDDAHAALAAHLTPRDRWIARMLCEHRVLTTPQLAALAFPTTTLRSTQRRLCQLAALGLLDSFRPLATHGSAPRHWVAPPLAYAMVAAEDGHDQAPSADSRTVSRGVALAHNEQLGHQLGVNAHLITLATTPIGPGPGGGPRGGLRVWWGQTRCRHQLGPARPDAYAIWTPAPEDTTGTGGTAFAFEFDTGSETLAQLASKLAGYHHLALDTAILTPVLLWLPNRRREANARAALAHARTALDQPRLVPVFTASPAPGRPGGWHPATPIWTPLPTATSDTDLSEAGPPLSLAKLPEHPSLIGARSGLTHADLTGRPGTEEVDGFDPGQLNATAWRSFTPTHTWAPPSPTPPPASPMRA